MSMCTEPAGFITQIVLVFLTFLNSFMMLRFISYRNQSIDLLFKSMHWFLYNGDLRHESVRLVNLGNHICLTPEICGKLFTKQLTLKHL